MDYSNEGGKDQSISKKMSILLGPFGGSGGTSWDDGIYDGVREITLVYGWCIDSIRVVYEKNGKPITCEKHGGDGGSNKAEIKLQYPEEFLVSASGYYCTLFIIGPVIRSITFKSNKRIFGPYGIETGTPFTLPMDGGSIVGFIGKSGWYLDALGFRVSHSQSPKLLQKSSVLLGPWGGNGGTSWDDGIHDGVREITLVYGWCIDSIRVVYDKNGKPVTCEKHGGSGGSNKGEIKLQYPEEFLVSASGYYCPLFIIGPVIRAITFKSNKRTFGPYGIEKGKPFTLPMDGGSIGGFMGRSGWYLDALGFHVSHSQSPMLLQKSSILLGPWGGNGGTSWDDGIYDGVREITLVYGWCIDSIRVVYDKNGKPITCEKHGGTGGSDKVEIKLQYPEEFLVCASGHYCYLFMIGPVIRAITLKSNKRTFGPYGIVEGVPFTLSIDGGSIVGFMGRSGWYVDALGFRVSHKLL